MLIACPALLPSAVRREHVINMLVANDRFTGTDRHYTSGVMANYIICVDDGPGQLKDMDFWFPGIEDDDKINVSISIGHELCTPSKSDGLVSILHSLAEYPR